jgi:hypothetical protein
MMKRYLLAAIVLCLGGLALAEITTINSPQYYGKTNIPKAYGVIDANFSAITSGVGAGSTSLSVTNGQPVTVSGSFYVLTGIGGANDTTNTVTLSNPTAAGQTLEIIVATASTNLVKLADSGNVAGPGDLVLDANDTAVLKAVDTSTWCVQSTSNN